MKFPIISIITLLSFVACTPASNLVSDKGTNDTPKSKADVEVLLLGTFHFRNFDPKNNLDVSQTNEVDVLTEQNQKELEYITDQIAEFNPDKIFVEYPRDLQTSLDSTYLAFETTDWTSKSRNEIVQLAFRAAKKANHETVYACDYRNTSFPYMKMIESMQNAGQRELLEWGKTETEKYEREYNELVAKSQSVTDCLLYINDKQRRKDNLGWYVSIANQAGTVKDEVGTLLASEWYKRNLYMYSYIQKEIEERDERIMILSGGSHTAAFQHFIDLNPKWDVIELEDIL